MNEPPLTPDRLRWIDDVLARRAIHHWAEQPTVLVDSARAWADPF